ncbi:MAG TPA: signal recognition particle receptor subunit alpha, partial [Patescibacteria group bacterium]|nr:signal recognition particle receptor subunit alpha [Patescibacteria group bacterium]
MALKELFKSAFQTKLAALFAAGKDREATLGELEELLILADISLPAVEEIIAQLGKKTKNTSSKEDFDELLRRELLALFAGTQRSPLAGGGKNIILLVGVNGSGKTTSAAKLAHHYQKRGRRVLLAAADTFRAAGSTQLSLWGQKLDIPVVSGERGADPGSVVFNSLQSWQNKNFDLLIIDTAGRMQSKDNLMK